MKGNNVKAGNYKKAGIIILIISFILSVFSGVNIRAASNGETTLEKLQALIVYADTLVESDYTKDSWETFQETRDSIVDPTQIPEQYREAILNSLQAAIDQLEKAKKEETMLKKLQALIAYADTLKESDYTEESWETFQETRDSIVDPTQLPEKFQETILNLLQDAIDQLQKKTDQPVEPDPDEPGKDGELEDGIYRIKLAAYEDANKEALYESTMGTVGYTGAAVMEAKDQHYKITLKITELAYAPVVNILKKEYMDKINWDREKQFDYIKKMGTKCWNGLDTSELPDNIKAGIKEENNIYWHDLDITYNEDGSKFITFETDDISDLVIYRGWTKNVDLQYFDLKTEAATNVNDLKFEEMDAVGYEISGLYYKEHAGKFFSNSIEWSVNGRNAVAKVKVTDYLAEAASNISFKDHKGTTLEFDGQYLSIPYSLDDGLNLYFGKSIYMTADTPYTKGMTFNLNFLMTPGAQQIVLEEAVTGTQVVTLNNVIPESAKLVAKEIIDDPSDNEDDYSLINNNLSPGSYKNIYMYNWKVEYEKGEVIINPTSPVTMRFRIPDGWNADNVYLFSCYGGAGWKPGIKGNIEEDETGKYFVYQTNVLGSYALYEMKTLNDAGDLEDGTYEIPLSVYHMTTEGALSMADRCLGDVAKVVVKDGVKTLYMDYTTVENLNMISYMTKMWLFGEDTTVSGGWVEGSLIPVTFTSYYKNADNSYLTDDFNRNSLNYYPKTGYVELVSNAARWPARFKVPIMDEIGGGDFSQNAWLTLDWAGAEKVSDDTPDVPIKDAVKEAMSIAETAVKEEYTEESWKAFETAFRRADEVYVNGTKAEMQTAYQNLMEEIGNLKKPDDVQLEAGLYTATGKIGDTQSVTGTRLTVDANGSVTIRMNVTGMRNFQYYDLEEKTYINAELQSEEVDGVLTVTSVTFTIGQLATTMAVQYVDPEGKTVTGSLKLTEIEAQSVTKEELLSILTEANELLKEAAADSSKYDPNQVALLQSAVAVATAVSQDVMAIQSEVDAQAESVKEAIGGLTFDTDVEALKAAIKKAETVEESLYTPNSYQRLTDALQSAQKLLKQEVITGQEVAAEILNLNAALNGLAERADKTLLIEIYDEATAITDSGYAGWEDLQKAIVRAKEVLEDKNAAQKEVDAQIRLLQAAVEHLEGGIDKSVLSDLIAQAEQINADSYSEDSAAFFRASIASAKAVKQDPQATQQAVDKQIQLLEAVSAALIQKLDTDVVYNGTYTINGVLRHAAADQDSMGNAAMVKPMELIVNGDHMKLRIEFVPLTTNLGSTKFTGYLAEFQYFPDWNGGETGYDMPAGQTAEVPEIESYYEDIYDTYNDPDNGIDANVKGKLYPHYMVMPVDLNDGEIWVQVYVPVMESINTGSGRQYAKLQLDWSTLTQVTGVESEKTELQKKIAEAEMLLSNLQNDTQGFSEEFLSMLKQAVTAAKAVHTNLNVDQTAIDATGAALKKALAVFDKEEVITDKTQLKKAIETADTYLNNSDVSYTEETRAILQNARDRAQKVYENAQASQTQINLYVSAIDKAIQGLVIEGTDKTELKKALSLAQTYLQATKDYSAAALEVLETLYNSALEVYEKGTATQEEINAQSRILNYAVSELKKVEVVQVDKSGLHTMLLTASNMAGRESLYTAASVKTLKKAISAAQSVYNDENATQKAVHTQASALALAMIQLEQTSSQGQGGSGNTNGDTDGSNDGTNGGTNGGSEAGNGNLDIKNLADGIYALTGSMVKIDKTTASMSNEAINHTVKLTVKDGIYYITLDFKGLSVSGSYGYLSDLKYFASGYTLDKYGNPTGALVSAAVDSYQKDASGTVVKDNFGTNYPDLVTFPLLKEALNNGYVPLQVFVPIMESIAAGTGTQPVFLKLDWSTLKATDKNDQAFTENNENNNGGETQENGNGSGNESGNHPLLNNGISGTGNNSTLTSKTPSLTGGSSLSSGTSSLKSAASTTSGNSALKSSSNALNTGNSGLTSSKGLNGGTTLTSAATGSAKKVLSEQSGNKKTSAAAVPAVMSLLAALTGVFYKVKSRKNHLTA